MSTGLKMQYPEAVKENGKKIPQKIHHLFLINLIFLCGKTCTATDLCMSKIRQSSSSPAPSQLDILCVVWNLRAGGAVLTHVSFKAIPSARQWAPANEGAFRLMHPAGPA